MTDLDTKQPASAGRTPRTGAIAFVGAGPGDPALLTLRAAELLAGADVVVLDASTSRQLLAHCRADVAVLDGNVDSDGKLLAPTLRGRRLVDAARRGQRVVRLLDGDPALYGRVSEEATSCRRAGVPFEIVPGVSSISAVPTYAGIPLTTSKSREVRVVDASRPGIRWAAHGAGTATLVVLDGLDTIQEIAEGLMAGGRAPSTPVAVTAGGTTTSQHTVVSSLDEVARAAEEAGIVAPTITVVGEVVELRQKLSWFESKPLFGWRVLVPRTKEQAGPLSAALASYGAVPEEVPTIAVEPPRTPQQIERAIKGLVTGRYSWIAFTSRNAVKAIREKFEEYGLDARAFSGLKVAAVGDQTAADLIGWGIRPDLLPPPEDQSAAGLVQAWPAYDRLLDPIDRVFLPRADIATDVLVAGLRQLGWQVDDVVAYRTVRAAPPPAPVREAIKNGGFDAVAFTSSSTVRNLIGIAGKPHPSTVIACIGPRTARTAQEHGLRVDVVAPDPSAGALAEALAAHAGTRPDGSAGSDPGTRPAAKRAPNGRRVR